MSNEIHYKGFTGTINFCNTDKILYGKVTNAPKGTYISYHGNSIEEIMNDFHEAIDLHLLEEADVVQIGA